MKLLNFWAPVFLWTGLIFSFSNLQVQPSSQIYWQDFLVKKTAHVVEYGVLFTLLYRALLNTTSFGKTKSALFAFLFVMLYGISDEFHQSFTPGREPNPRDVIIDGIGGAIAWFLIWKYLPKAPARLRSLAKSLGVV